MFNHSPCNDVKQRCSLEGIESTFYKGTNEEAIGSLGQIYIKASLTMSQIGVGDIITAVKVVWTVYESVRDGPTGATGDFNSFRQEFRAIKVLLERIQRVKESTSGDVRHLGAFYHETIQECAQFVNKHKVLAQDKPSTDSSRRGSLGKKVSIWFEKVTWPLERSEAERLRQKLERCLSIATLRSTEETRDATLGFMRIAENNQLENLEMLKSIKTMTAQISLLLRKCIIDGPIDTGDYDTHHSSQRGHRPRLAGLRPEHILSGIPEDDEVPSLDSQRYQRVLDRIREISERLGNLTRRLDTHGLPVGPPQPTSRKNTLNSDTGIAETPTVDAMVLFLHQVSDDVRDALEMVGYGHELVPNYKRSERDQAVVKPAQSINDTAEEWEQFRHWLDFQLTNEPEAIEAVDINGGVKVTQTIVRGSTTVKSSMLPYVPSSRVTTLFSDSCSIWFQGSHKAKIEDQQSVIRYSISPIYKCRDRSEL
ncbi:hypothetical protein APSETT445_009275 [Aspergillus pseudonomiae]